MPSTPTISAPEALPALQPSSVEFIEKASGIKHRYVLDKQGLLDVERMVPDIPERPNEQLSLMAEVSVMAAKQALERAGRDAERRRCGDLLVLVAAAALPGAGHRGAERAGRGRLWLRHERRLLLGDVRDSERLRHRARRACAFGAGGQPGTLHRPSQFARPRHPFHFRRRGGGDPGRARRHRPARRLGHPRHQTADHASPTTSATISASSIAATRNGRTCPTS